MKNLFSLLLLLLCFNIINAQVLGDKNTHIAGNRNVKATPDPSKRIEYKKINVEENATDFNLKRDLVFFKEGGYSAKYKLTSIEISKKIIPLVADTLVLEANKYFEFLTKNYGKFIIRINQNSDLSGGVKIDLWVLKNQEQNILRK
jgi:hypothetical protein